MPSYPLSLSSSNPSFLYALHSPLSASFPRYKVLFGWQLLSALGTESIRTGGYAMSLQPGSFWSMHFSLVARDSRVKTNSLPSSLRSSAICRRSCTPPPLPYIYIYIPRNKIGKVAKINSQSPFVSQLVRVAIHSTLFHILKTDTLKNIRLINSVSSSNRWILQKSNKYNRYI